MPMFFGVSPDSTVVLADIVVDGKLDEILVIKLSYKNGHISLFSFNIL